MEIFHIFDNNLQGLYSIKYDECNDSELDRLFNEWEDISFLENFFNTHHTQLREFYSQYSIDEAVMRTIEETEELQNQLLNSYETNEKHLDHFFIPLHKIYSKSTELEEHKAYGIFQNSWLRLYALKLEPDYYLITGGGIKLTDSMNDDKLLKKELDKLERCKQYCKEEGIYDKDGLQSFK